MLNYNSTEEIMGDLIELGKVSMAVAILCSFQSEGKKRKALLHVGRKRRKRVPLSLIKGEKIVTPYYHKTSLFNHLFCICDPSMSLGFKRHKP